MESQFIATLKAEHGKTKALVDLPETQTMYESLTMMQEFIERYATKFTPPDTPDVRAHLLELNVIV